MGQKLSKKIIKLGENRPERLPKVCDQRDRDHSQSQAVGVKSRCCTVIDSDEDQDDEVEKAEDFSMFLTIPQEVRIKILAQLSTRDRQTLRTLCKQLSSEIDLLVGPTDYMRLGDLQCKKCLQFYARCRITGVEISRPASSLSFQAVAHPLKITSLRFTKGGIVSPEFALGILQKCANLRDLMLCGIIKGLINPYGPEILMPRLKTLNVNSAYMAVSYLLDSHLSAFLNVLNGRPFDLNSVMTFWHNQLSLIRRLHCPVLEQATLFVYTCENTAMEDSDEAELMSEILKFLCRHKDLKSLRLFHAQRPVESRHLEYQHPLSFFNRSFRPLQNANYMEYANANANALVPGADADVRNPPANANVPNFNDPDPPFVHEYLSDRKFKPLLKDSRLKEVLFSSRLNCQFHNDPERNFETYVINFLKWLRNLETVKYSATKGRSVIWANVEEIVQNNFKSLVVLEIVGKIEGPINFGGIAECQRIKVIRLNNKQKYRHASLSPVIENFGPHQSMSDNLETLIIQNIGLRSNDFESLPQLRKLKHLGIYRWRCGPGEQSLTFKGIQGVFAMRTLDALLVPWPRVFVFDSGCTSEEERKWIQKVTLKLHGFMHPKDARRLGLVQYLCIDDGQETLWTKNEWGFRIKSSFTPPDY